MKNLESYLNEMIHAAVQNAVHEAFETVIIKHDIGSEPAYFTKEKVMELTGWSSRTIQHLRDSGQISYFQHGRKILYPRDALYLFLESHTLKRKSASNFL